MKSRIKFINKFLVYILFFSIVSDMLMTQENQVSQTVPPPQADVSCSDSDGSSPSVKPYDDVKKIALTFDDGPHSSTTPRLLAGLRERGVRATFFVVGANADKNRDILKQMYEDGHMIGNHTNTHCNLSLLPCDSAISEIKTANQVIYEVTGSYSEFLRPPFGECAAAVNESLNMFKVMWNVDPRDWSVQNKKSVVNYVVSHVKDGDIILLHDIFDTSVDAALEIIDILSAEGYAFVTADEILFP